MGVSQRVEYMARLLRGLDWKELSQLVELLPELARAARLQEAREEAVLYFTEEGRKARAGKFPHDDEIFIEGLTYGEYFALTEAEKDALWERIWVQAEKPI